MQMNAEKHMLQIVVDAVSGNKRKDGTFKKGSIAVFFEDAPDEKEILILRSEAKKYGARKFVPHAGRRWATIIF